MKSKKGKEIKRVEENKRISLSESQRLEDWKKGFSKHHLFVCLLEALPAICIACLFAYVSLGKL